MSDLKTNSDQQNQVLDLQRHTPEHMPELFREEGPLENKKRYPQNINRSLSMMAAPRDSHNVDTIDLHQKPKKTDQQHNSRTPSNVLPIYHGFNASSVLNHFSSTLKFNKSKTISTGANPGPGGHTTNRYVKPLQQISMLRNRTEAHRSTKDTCSLFGEEIMNPTFQPIPVCGSKDYPVHTIHCYQSSMSIAPYRTFRSANGPKIVNGDRVNVGMGVTCTFQNIAVNVKNVMESLRDCTRNCDVRSSKSVFLLDGKLSQCPIPTVSMLMNKTDQLDYTRNFVQELLMLNKKTHLNPSQCDHWINKTAVFFIANEPYNVYFQFLTYYNVFLTMNLLSSKQEGAFRGLASFKSDPRDLVLVRLSDATDYKFGDFERKLFPQLSMLNQLSNVAKNRSGSVGNDGDNIICFQKVVKVPWAYSAFPFRSVVDSQLRNQTLRCYNTVRNQAKIDPQTEGNVDVLQRGHPQNSVNQGEVNMKHTEIRLAPSRSQAASVVPSMLVFRSLVLRTCGIEESVAQDRILRGGDILRSSLRGGKVVVRQRFPLQVLVIQRKPYLRHGLDHPNLFQRILTNEAELLTALTRNISQDLFNVKSVYMEELDICDQVKVAHSADILIGVHGAGLVHSWWMRESGALLELAPLTKLDRPTYKVLAGLTGKKYYSVILKNSPQKHQTSVSISAVLELLVRITKEWTTAM